MTEVKLLLIEKSPDSITLLIDGVRYRYILSEYLLRRYLALRAKAGELKALNYLKKISKGGEKI